MQVTFITRLIVAMVSELESKGFKIGSTDITENEIEVLVFSNNNSDYAVGVSLENGEQGEYLELTGSVRRERWWDTGLVEPLLTILESPNDGINIKRTKDGDVLVTLTKFFNAKLSMENIDKNATRAIALDILGSILNY